MVGAENSLHNRLNHLHLGTCYLTLTRERGGEKWTGNGAACFDVEQAQMIPERERAAINSILENVNRFRFRKAKKACGGGKIKWRARGDDDFHYAFECRRLNALASKVA